MHAPTDALRSSCRSELGSQVRLTAGSVEVVVVAVRPQCRKDREQFATKFKTHTHTKKKRIATPRTRFLSQRLGFLSAIFPPFRLFLLPVRISTSKTCIIFPSRMVSRARANCARKGFFISNPEPNETIVVTCANGWVLWEEVSSPKNGTP